MDNNPKFSAGMFKGRAIANTPREYLEWYLEFNREDTPEPEFREAVIRLLAKWDRMTGVGRRGRK